MRSQPSFANLKVRWMAQPSHSANDRNLTHRSVGRTRQSEGVCSVGREKSEA